MSRGRSYNEPRGATRPPVASVVARTPSYLDFFLDLISILAAARAHPTLIVPRRYRSNRRFPMSSGAAYLEVPSVASTAIRLMSFFNISSNYL